MMHGTNNVKLEHKTCAVVWQCYVTSNMLTSYERHEKLTVIVPPPPPHSPEQIKMYSHINPLCVDQRTSQQTKTLSCLKDLLVFLVTTLSTSKL